MLKQKLSVPPEKERLAAEAKKPGTVSQPKYYGNIRGIAQPATTLLGKNGSLSRNTMRFSCGTTRGEGEKRQCRSQIIDQCCAGNWKR